MTAVNVFPNTTFPKFKSYFLSLIVKLNLVTNLREASELEVFYNFRFRVCVQ